MSIVLYVWSVCSILLYITYTYIRVHQLATVTNLICQRLNCNRFGKHGAIWIEILFVWCRWRMMMGKHSRTQFLLKIRRVVCVERIRHLLVSERNNGKIQQCIVYTYIAAVLILGISFKNQPNENLQKEPFFYQFISFNLNQYIDFWLLLWWWLNILFSKSDAINKKKPYDFVG